MKKLALLLVCSMFVLTACSTPQQSSPSPQKVVLKSYMYGTGGTKDLLDAINKKFEEKYPNITIENEMAPSDQFDTVIKTKLASGDIPDIFGIRPGTSSKSLVDAGYLMDLSNEPWVSHIQPALKPSLTYGGKVYGIPLENNFIATVYNKKMFDELGLKIPTTWNEFTAVCDTLKKAGKIPMALGLKTPYVNQLVPYTLAATIVNKADPELNNKITEGKAKFAGSAWKTVMDQVLEMKSKGYFNADAMGSTYDQAVQLFTTGKAAMITNGNWVLGSIVAANPNMQLGVMPIPATNNPDETRVVSALVVAMGASAKTKYPQEVKEYLEFLASPGTLNAYLKGRGALSPFDNVTISPNPAMQLINQYLTQKKSADFSGDSWNPAVQGKFMSEAQALYSGAISTDQMMQDLDTENAATLKN